MVRKNGAKERGRDGTGLEVTRKKNVLSSWLLLVKRTHTHKWKQLKFDDKKEGVHCLRSAPRFKV